MADAKITELTSYTTPIDTDVLPIVDVTNDITKKITYNGLSSNSLYRQAIINGNFDVWQRGTSVTNLAEDAFLADRWKNKIGADGGTLPSNIIHSRQVQTSGDLFGSNYFYRIAPDGAGSGYGNGSYGSISNYIENGTSKLCGNGKTVTLSFYARSSIANKKIGTSVMQNYGTGGSPSATETITGTSWTLTSSWVKYTHTFTTNTLSGKTFGTDNNDYLRVLLFHLWGSTTGTSNGLGSAETFVGAGNIDIAQVQLCAGSVALPFQPKSFAEELRDCQRYYQTRVVRTINGIMNYGLPVDLRATPATATASAGTIANATATGYQITHNANANSTVVLSSEL